MSGAVILPVNKDQVYRKPENIIPPDDEARLQKLYEYNILDTPAEDVFDKIAGLASEIFETPAAFVTFVDRDRVFLKSNLSSLKETEIIRKDSFCTLTILEDTTLVIKDTYSVPAFRKNPFVQASGIRFYAGAPLKTAEGFCLGTVCVTDSVPREVTEKQVRMLASLSALAMDELESRLNSKKAIRAQTDLMNITVHDLKNPASTILLSLKILERLAIKDDFAGEALANIQDSADRILATLNDLLHLSQIENGRFRLNKEEANINEILEATAYNFRNLAYQKKQRIRLEAGEDSIHAKVERGRLKEVAENLISNAIKYSYPGTEIKIHVARNNNIVHIRFEDQGQGLNEEDKKKLFTPFAKLSSIPTGKERSNGLGLNIVKTLVELHNGRVWAESEGKDRGSTFHVTLPV